VRELIPAMILARVFCETSAPAARRSAGIRGAPYASPESGDGR